MTLQRASETCESTQHHYSTRTLVTDEVNKFDMVSDSKKESALESLTVERNTCVE